MNILNRQKIPRLGALMESFFMTVRLFSFASTVAIVIVLYANIQPFLLRYTPWIKLWSFIAILAVIGLTGMGLVHKFLLPAIKSHQEKQNHNDTNDRLERIEGILLELKERK